MNLVVTLVLDLTTAPPDGADSNALTSRVTRFYIEKVGALGGARDVRGTDWREVNDEAERKALTNLARAALTADT